MLAVNDLCGVANYDGMGRYVKIHEGKRRDQDIIPNRDVSNDTSIAPNPDIVTNCGITLSFPPELHPNGNALVHGTIPPDYGFIVHGYVSAMD